MIEGTLVKGIGSFYTARTPEGTEYILRCPGRFRRERMRPMVGDEVRFLPGEGENHGWIQEILPRRSVIVRPPVANVSLLVIVLAPEPAPDLVLTDRLMAQAFGQGMKVLLAVNKSDLDREGLWDRVQAEYALACPTLRVCAKNGEGLPSLREHLRGETGCFAGQSGVGKSALLNALFGLARETGDISAKIGRGRNTTRAVEMIIQDDIRVMDSAGFNFLEFGKGINPESLRAWYPEFAPFEGKCRFRGCFHDQEPGCAVWEAVERGALLSARPERYRKLLAELRQLWDNRFE